MKGNSFAVAVARSALIGGLLWCGWLSAAEPGSPAVQEDPLDRQVLEIAKDLRCAVCQNQPVAESNADLAKDMRKLIRDQIQSGKSRDEIVDYFVARYGDYVLMKPPADRAGLLLWVAPPLVLAVLAFFAWLFLRRRSNLPTTSVPTLSDEDRARVRAARSKEES
jgi:cytochrome c-type biogenesis protein CcmH